MMDDFAALFNAPVCPTCKRTLPTLKEAQALDGYDPEKRAGVLCSGCGEILEYGKQGAIFLPLGEELIYLEFENPLLRHFQRQMRLGLGMDV